LSFLRQLLGHVHLGKSPNRLDDQLALLMVRVKPALHLLEGIPGRLPGSGQLQSAGTTERQPTGRTAPSIYSAALIVATITRAAT
jgi:hypothetical protein